MGGLALKNTVTRRYQKDEFENIIPEIQTKVKKYFTDALPTKYYRSKESFGDADILVLLDKPVTFKIIDMIKDEFGANEVVCNGNVYSFDYKELQVDLILTPLSNWESAQTYFSWNDLHNLVGKVAQRFGLKWGYDGLKYVYYTGAEKSNKLGNIYLTKDYRKALEFLGFDVERYEKGFDTLDEIFQFVIDSKYFNPNVFDLALQNKTNRDRDKKRNTYAKWLDVIEPLKATTPGHQFLKKEEYFDHIASHFPNFKSEYDQLTLKEIERKELYEKFNGHLLMEWGVDKMLIGKHINGFKQFVEKDFNEYLKLNNNDQIKEHFLYYLTQTN